MDRFETEQETFWAGAFGDEYIKRNSGEETIAANTALFSKIFSRAQPISSLVEFGANIGLNLVAIRRLFPNIALTAVEINEKAANELQKIRNIQIHKTSVLACDPNISADVVLSKGFLIHIQPSKLNRVYEIMYQSASKYICLAEYYNPKPLEVEYRGHKGKLFKRDFAGEMMKRFHDLRLSDYGFIYHNDPNFSQDDLNWFLLEKR